MVLLKRPINFSLQTHCVQSCHTARPYFSGTKHCYSPLASCSCLTSTFSCHNSDFSLGFSLNYTLISEFQSAWEFHTHDCFCGCGFPKAWLSQWIDTLQNKIKQNIILSWSHLMFSLFGAVLPEAGLVVEPATEEPNTWQHSAQIWAYPGAELCLLWGCVKGLKA